MQRKILKVVSFAAFLLVIALLLAVLAIVATWQRDQQQAVVIGFLLVSAPLAAFGLAMRTRRRSDAR